MSTFSPAPTLEATHYLNMAQLNPLFQLTDRDKLSSHVPEVGTTFTHLCQIYNQMSKLDRQLTTLF